MIDKYIIWTVEESKNEKKKIEKAEQWWKFLWNDMVWMCVTLADVMGVV